MPSVAKRGSRPVPPGTARITGAPTAREIDETPQVTSTAVETVREVVDRGISHAIAEGLPMISD